MATSGFERLRTREMGLGTVLGGIYGSVKGARMELREVERAALE